MGHRANFIIRTEAEDKYLVESNNSLPFFWIALLDKEIIESCRESWKYYDKLAEQNNEEALEQYTDIIPSPLWFHVSNDAFKRNRKTANNYLQKLNSGALDLFIEFCNYIETQYSNKIEPDEFIMLDIIALSGFYNTAIEFLDKLLSEISKINTSEQTNLLDTTDLIASGMGFACAGFEQTSITYQTILRKRNTLFSR